MRHLLNIFAIVVASLLVSAGCDSGTTGGQSGPYTRCDYGIVEKNPNTGGYSEACESSADCDYGVCLKPGDAGNTTNTAFGFCSRGCDCNDDVNSRLSPDEKLEGWSCLYPTTPAQHKRHVVLQCSSVAQCQTFDARWNACRLPEAGGSRRVCHAD